MAKKQVKKESEVTVTTFDFSSEEAKQEVKEISKEDLVKERLKTVMAEINKKVGKGAVALAEEYDGSFLLRRPTGILSLDLALKGGFPKGIIEIIGEPNIGKTALVTQVAKTIQNIYGNETCIGICAIEKFDKKFWKDLGLKVAFSDSEIEQLEKALERKLEKEELAYYKEQIGNIVVSPAMTAEDAFEAALGMAQSGIFQLVVVDSIGAMLTETQADKDIDEKTYGGLSMPIGNFANKLSLSDSNTTVIIINQLRDNLKMKNAYDDPYKEAGGWALKHAKNVSLRLSREGVLKEKVGTSGQEVVIGRGVKWNIKKGKAGISDGDIGNYSFYKGKFGYPLGIDIDQDIILTALEKDVMEKSGTWFVYKGERIGQGIQNACSFLRARPEIKDEIIKKVYEQSGLAFIVKE